MQTGGPTDLGGFGAGSDRFGTHRVLEPKGTLPQAAWRLDNDMTRLFDDEILLDVERLNIDSASFAEMAAAAPPGAVAEHVAARVLETVRTRGKQHNPVTGSGGMLLGRVARVGPALRGSGDGPHASLVVGERVATLVSLTLTPLKIDRIDAVDCQRHQVQMIGQAILFESGAWARLPSDLPETAALAALDIAGAAPQVARRVRPGARVLILGCGGKSGLLCSAAARRAGAAVVVGVERSDESAAGARRLGACHALVIADAADAVAVASAAVRAAGGEFDLTVSCVNLPDAEMGAILATRDGGAIYFFSMATSFTKAALGAEGVSRDVDMLVGNGYCPGHAEATLTLLREDAALRQLFIERYG
jgi:L-erythro-3,5-diaminohexanoate dehydrogenase